MPTPAHAGLHRAALLAHGALLVAVATAFGPSPTGALTAVAAVTPLLIALPGLWRQRRYTLQWLAVALVLYAGAAVVEVVAASGRDFAPSMALLAALLELGLLLALIRAAPPTTPRE